jgi:hypothetical protein
MLAEGGATPAERIRFAFRLAVARHPGEQELAALQRTFERQLSIFQTNQQAALELLGVGESPRVTPGDPTELAAWTMVASVILNLDETLTKG